MGTPGEQAAAVLRGVGTGFGSTDAEREMARRTVARLALDSTDAALLLDALALTPPAAPARKPGHCPVCDSVMPVESASPKWGHPGVCSRACLRQRRKGAA